MNDHDPIQDDLMFDLNLKNVAKRINLPRSTPLQRGRWTQLLKRGEPSLGEHRKGTRPMYKKFSLLIGGAFAASLIIGAAVLVNVSEPVSANMILDSFQANFKAPSKITFDDVVFEVDEQTPSGQIYVHHAADGMLYFDPRGAMFVDAVVEFSVSTPKLPDGMDAALRMVLSIAEGSPSQGYPAVWTYLRTLGDIKKKHLPFELTRKLLAEGFYLNVTEVAGFKLMKNSSGNAEDPTGVIPMLESYRDKVEDLRDPVRAHELVSKFINKINDVAEVTVNIYRDGSSVLTASNFDFGSEQFHRLLGDITVTMGYDQVEGVRWVHVNNVGKRNGSIRVQLSDVDFDDNKLDIDYHTVRQPATVINSAEEWNESFELPFVDMLSELRKAP